MSTMRSASASLDRSASCKFTSYANQNGALPAERTRHHSDQKALGTVSTCIMQYCPSGPLRIERQLYTTS